MRKWSPNDREIVNKFIGEKNKGLGYFITDDNTKKTLGFFWNDRSDELEYMVSINSPSSKKLTKRNILSVITKIFDRLGLVGPVTMRAKIILQRLWIFNLGWDEAIPLELFTIWSELQLPRLNKIRISRQARIKGYVELLCILRCVIKG